MAQLSDDGTFVDESPREARGTMLNVEIPKGQPITPPEPSPSQAREHAMRLEDDLAVLEAERSVSNSHRSEDQAERLSMRRSRSRRSEPLDEFDVATNPLHETAAVYRPPDDPSNKLALFFKKVHNSSFIIRYFTYIVPVVTILLVPLLLGALVFQNANVGGVELLWFSVWLEIVWLTLWAGRVRATQTERKQTPKKWNLLTVMSWFTDCCQVHSGPDRIDFDHLHEQLEEMAGLEQGDGAAGNAVLLVVGGGGFVPSDDEEPSYRWRYVHTGLGGDDEQNHPLHLRGHHPQSDREAHSPLDCHQLPPPHLCTPHRD